MSFSSPLFFLLRVKSCGIPCGGSKKCSNRTEVNMTQRAWDSDSDDDMPNETELAVICIGVFYLIGICEPIGSLQDFSKYVKTVGIRKVQFDESINALGGFFQYAASVGFLGAVMWNIPKKVGIPVTLLVSPIVPPLVKFLYDLLKQDQPTLIEV